MDLPGFDVEVESIEGVDLSVVLGEARVWMTVAHERERYADFTNL